MKDLSNLRRKLLSSERGTIRKKSFSLGVALGFPNSYQVGMANLGYQTIYRFLNQMEGVACERFFAKLSDEELDFSTHPGVRTLESNRKLKSFDIIAFSVPFELDYINILRMLRISNISLKSSQRSAGDPLIIAGGVAITLNPETMAPFFDCVLIGEAEESLPDLVRTYVQSARRKISREETLLNLSKIRGAYVPQFYDIVYDRGGEIKKRKAKEGIFKRIERRKADVCKIETFSPISSPYIHFKNSLLVEVGRGCARGCLFCAAGYICRPCRFHDKNSILTQVDKHRGEVQHVGLVGSLISDHPDLENICSDLYQRGIEIGASSFRVDKISSHLLKLLVGSGLKTLTVAPEVGSEKMWKVIKKNISAEDVFKSARMAAEAGIYNLKLYFIIGLPFEENQDIDGIVDLVRQIHQIYVEPSKHKRKHFDSVKGGTHRNRRLILSVNPFVPKPHTPFQWCAMNTQKELKSRMTSIETRVKNLKGVRFEKKSIRGAILQGILSVGSRRAGEALFYHVQENLTLSQAWRKAGVDVNSLIFKEKSFGSSLPWDFIDSGTDKTFLKRELERAKEISRAYAE
jgi:radical SAM superfamily enzyme YgiQ (UPF0313 family)